MSRSLVERRLGRVATRMAELRKELTVAEEQLAHFTDVAEEHRVRALVAETPQAGVEYREAQKHADAMVRHRDSVVAEIKTLERTQDELLDRLVAQR